MKEDLQELNSLKHRLTQTAKVFSPVIILAITWLIIGHLQLLRQESVDVGNIVIVSILFILGLPASALVHMDSLTSIFPNLTSTVAIVVSLMIAMLNFFLISFVLWFFKKK